MSTGKIAIGLLAFSLTLGLGVAAFAGDPAPRRINAVDLGDDNDVAARRDDAADDLVAVDNGDKDPDDDGTKGDDGTNGGDNTVDEPSAASVNDDSVDEPSAASVDDDSVDTSGPDDDNSGHGNDDNNDDNDDNEDSNG